MLIACHATLCQNNSDNLAGVPEDQELVNQVFGLHVVNLESEFYSDVAEGYDGCINLTTIVHILKKNQKCGE